MDQNLGLGARIDNTWEYKWPTRWRQTTSSAHVATWKRRGATTRRTWRALLQYEPGKIPTAILLTELGENFMQLMLPTQFGIHDGMPARKLAAAAEKMRNDPTVRVSRVLLETLQAVAPTATPDQVEIIARALINYLLAISRATEGDVPPMISALRESALQRSNDA